MGHFDDVGLTSDGLSSSCVGFSSLPCPLQTAQRAEFWGRLLDSLSGVRPLELVDDGDLIILVRKLLSIRGEGTVRIFKVKGHADESLVRNGQVRALDRYGNARAGEAADFGRRRVLLEVADARRNLSGVCRRWYPVVLILHGLFIAISRAVVNCDGSSGLASHPLVWFAGAFPRGVALLLSFGMLLSFRVLFIFGIWLGWCSSCCRYC